MKQQQKKPITVFCSYAHEDEVLCRELEKHLSPLQRQGIITAWHDRQIVAGTDWTYAVNHHLNEASIILLLISPDFLASDYCYHVEMQRALERHKLGEARVIPVILRPVDWRKAPFAYLECLPRNGKSVTEWENRDAAFREIAEGIRATIEHVYDLSSQEYTYSASPTNQRNRERLLKRVHTFWIKGVLEQSLHQATLIELGLKEQPGFIENPWRFIIQESDRPPYLLPSGTHITQVYDEADGKLLILGKPGAGKTTLLLELARDLLFRAEHDDTHPIPVIFNLISWTDKIGFDKWLIEKLFIRYDVPHKIGEFWLNTNRVLLLLDGLDEFYQDYRKAYIRAINSYHQLHNLVPTVICSRTEEYLSQMAKITLYTAVEIQPLTIQQIDGYAISPIFWFLRRFADS